MSKNIIWLCSWYPNELDQFTGDFIQRQAIAASQFDSIEVVHVVEAPEDKCVIRTVNPYLKETIYYNKTSNKLHRYKDFFQLHESFISDYINRKGKPDCVHVHIPIKSGLIALRWKKNYDIPFIVTEHYGIYNEEVPDRFSKRNYFFKYFTKRILKQSSYFLPVSNSLGCDVNSYLPPKEFTVVPNVVDTSLFNYVENKSTKKRFIHVSNLTPNKNVDAIINAFIQVYQSNPQIELYIIGGEKKKYMSMASKHNLLNQAIFFLPELSYEAVATHVKEASIGVLFSTIETQSCAVLEWLCSGLPVITSAVGGVVELIRNDNGLRVEAGNIEALAVNMQQMLDNYDQYDRKQISEQAKALYSYDAVGRQLHHLYQKVN